ncbi:hypothetical protein CRG98_038263 [Punica granatum]|uniref:Uncharacterized protein n=1 Tax=Punica granatum TaxID=22663 RepID=A0A2I0IBK4_PUNGR|nr:hypothetical protein CRG98_038263 [Punica granatum]
MSPLARARKMSPARGQLLRTGPRVVRSSSESVELEASLVFVSPYPSTEEDARLGSVVKGGCFRHVAPVGPHIATWAQVRVGPSGYFIWYQSGLCFRMSTRICAWTHTMPGLVCPSAAKSAPHVSVPPHPSTEDEPGSRSIVEDGYLRARDNV